MTKIIPDTKYFHYYNANSHNHKCGDCTIRAISTILNQTWEKTFDELIPLCRKYGRLPNDPNIIDKYLKINGFIKQKEPRDFNNKKIRLKNWLEDNPNFNAVAYLGSSHIAAIINGRVFDIWNSSNEILHTYYIKGN